jgi:hypothetical protein
MTVLLHTFILDYFICNISLVLEAYTLFYIGYLEHSSCKNKQMR